MADAPALLRIQDGGFGHHPERWLFRHLNLTLTGGEVVMILGPNGAGKTSLLRCILGDARLREGDLVCPPGIGYVPQSLGLVFDFTVRDIVVMGRVRHVSLLGAPGPADWQAVSEALERVGMAAFATRSFASLSGGEKQLVLIARALVGGSPLLILDEPTAALDLANQDTVLQVLWQIKQDKDSAILMTTHDPQHAIGLADRVLLMDRHGNSTFGPTETLMTEDRLTALYGVPLRRHESRGTGTTPPHMVLAPLAPHWRGALS